MPNHDRELYAIGAIILVLVIVISDYWMYNVFPFEFETISILIWGGLIMANIFAVITIFNLLKKAL